MDKYNKNYWNKKYETNNIGWDIGYPAPALIDYFNQLSNKNICILIPGAGNAYEAEYLYKNGFLNTYILDFSDEAIKSFKKRCPFYPDNRIITEDFFEHNGQYDLIIEQTFFTSFVPEKRQKFVKKIFNLLSPYGKYVGLFFNHTFNNSFPPFGATKETYDKLFLKFFKYIVFQIAENSIKPRNNREFFVILEKNLKKLNKKVSK